MFLPVLWARVRKAQKFSTVKMWLIFFFFFTFAHIHENYRELHILSFRSYTMERNMKIWIEFTHLSYAFSHAWTQIPEILVICCTLKGLLHEIFGPVFLPVWMHRGLNRNRFWFLNFKEAPSIWDSHLSFYALHVKPSQRFLESARRIGNCVRSSLRFI